MTSTKAHIALLMGVGAVKSLLHNAPPHHRVHPPDRVLSKHGTTPNKETSFVYRV